jgi:hypothetical protein
MDVRHRIVATGAPFACTFVQHASIKEANAEALNKAPDRFLLTPF